MRDRGVPMAVGLDPHNFFGAGCVARQWMDECMPGLRESPQLSGARAGKLAQGGV